MSRIVHLKVKVKSLAAESKIIRLEENKARARARAAFEKSPFMLTIDKEACLKGYRALRDHRTGPVREVARHNLLAYGFLRGVPYTSMEARTFKAPDFDDVKRHARTFSEKWDEAEWATWLSEATKHLEDVARAA